MISESAALEDLGPNGKPGEEFSSQAVEGAEESKPSILIVDDDEGICKLLEKYLSEVEDCNILSVHSGIDALKICKFQLPDLLLTDVSMPMMDGFQLMEEFQKLPGSDAIPIILMSGLGEYVDRIRGLDQGAVDFLAKPFEPVEVVLRVQRHLKVRNLYKEVKRQETESKERAGVLEAILNSVPSGLAVLNENLEVIRHNQQFAQLFPGSQKAVIGVPISELCRIEMGVGEDSPDWQCPLSPSLLRTLKEGYDFQHREVKIYSSNDQSERIFLSMATRFPDRDDRLLLDIRDFTSQKEQQNKLSHRNRLAMLGDLAVGVAHEINNPNAFVRLNAGNMKTMLKGLEKVFGKVSEIEPDLKLGALSISEVKGRLEDAVGGILNATERIGGVVERLKTFGRDEEIGSEEVDLCRAVMDSAEITAHFLREVEELSIETENVVVPPVRGSQIEFEQIIINFMSNAAHAIEERKQNEGEDYKGSLRVWFEFDEENVALLMSDNGIGMSDETKAKIYTPYFTTKPRGKGTGLGMSISHGIISKAGGRIEVNTALRQGTTFKLIVPVVKSEAEAGNPTGEAL
jgi:signal transduction histidine kinase/CheY-like chemotaxis protein